MGHKANLDMPVHKCQAGHQCQVSEPMCRLEIRGQNNKGSGEEEEGWGEVWVVEEEQG